MPSRAASPLHPLVTPLGDSALLAELGSRVDATLNTRAIALAAALRRRRDVREAIPGYASVTVHYDPDQVVYATLAAAVERLARSRPPAISSGRLHRLPVHYDGPDLEETSARLRLPVEELVRVHTGVTYRVFMVGFVPGWAFLGTLPEALRLPRRRVPRTHVPPGSVAIAGAQTGVYSLPTPGGWHLIGSTTVPMFLPDSDPPLLLRTGDRVQFFPV